ncbi:MAG: hypothetical protein ACLSAF_17945 [Intestinimonas sp.]
MRKLKKINGYLVVRFNEREKREYETLGTYGVIDAELYTGHLEIDRDVFEYEDADSLEAAIEQARGLESELNVEEPERKVTVITETAEDVSVEEVDAQMLITGWERTLRGLIESRHHPEVDEVTATHALQGYKVALTDLGMLPEDECYTLPDVFRRCAEPEARETFAHLDGAEPRRGTCTPWGWRWRRSARTTTARCTGISSRWRGSWTRPWTRRTGTRRWCCGGAAEGVPGVAADVPG